MGLPRERIAILTGDMERRERLELVRRAKSGEIDVIISTLVGEEGIDIPEAGLLVMTDTPRSPLRFYQRLGRLIRMSSPRRMKYLVVSLTPRTIEYWDLEDALWKLYMEGVDVSYVIINIGEKTPSARIVDTINDFARIYNDVSIPYTILAFGQEFGNPLTYILNMIKSREELSAIVQRTMPEWGFSIETEEDFDRAVLHILAFSILGWGEAKKIFKPIDDAINRSRFSKEFGKAVREGKILYIYDADMLSEIISYRLQELYETCLNKGEKICYDTFFRIDRKSILRLFTRVFIRSNIASITERIRKRLERLREYLDDARRSNILIEYTIYASKGGYNEQSESLSPKLLIRLNLGDASIRLDAQINYYDISKELYRDENITRLIEENLLAIGYEASKKLLNNLREGMG